MTSPAAKKRERDASIDTAVIDICHREVGRLSTRKFFNRIAASEDLVLRLNLSRKLEKHRGCVNTVSFNGDGDVLVSGSDDKKVIFWDWEHGNVRLSFHSGHADNIFQAKIMPSTDDRSIVTCAADGQVRHAIIPERGQVVPKLLGKHDRRAHKLAIEPGSPHIFYTCGEDGLVQHFDLRTGVATKLFTCQPVLARSFQRVVNLHSIAMDPRNPNLFAIAGSDEYARLYDIRHYKWDSSTDFGKPSDHFCPRHLIGDENLGITGLAFSDQSELLASYCNDSIYLFSKDMGLGSDVKAISDNNLVTSDSEMETDGKVGPQAYKGHRNCFTVKGVNFFGPKCEYVVSGSDCGRMFIWRKIDSELIRVMEADNQVVNCIEAHPRTTMLASSGIERDIKIWTPSAVDKATLPTNIDEVSMSRARRFHFFPDCDDDSDEEDYSSDESSTNYSDSEEEDDYDMDGNDDYDDYDDDDDDEREDEYVDEDQDEDDNDGEHVDEEEDADMEEEDDGLTNDVPHEEDDSELFDGTTNDEYDDSLDDFRDDED